MSAHVHSYRKALQTYGTKYARYQLLISQLPIYCPIYISRGSAGTSPPPLGHKGELCLPFQTAGCEWSSCNFLSAGYGTAVPLSGYVSSSSRKYLYLLWDSCPSKVTPLLAVSQRTHCGGILEPLPN